jgi:hypothetical protein
MKNNKCLNINGQKLDAMLNSKLTQRILIVLFLIYIIFESFGKGDFFIYYTAASKVFGNDSIYVMTFGDGFHYLYSLFFAICLYPFTFLPFYLCKLLWLSLNAVLLVRLFTISFSFFENNEQPFKIPTWFYSIVFLFTFRFIHENFHAAQITIVILYLCLEAVNFIFNKNKVILGSLILAIGINIKLLPIVLIPYLFYRQKFKALLYIFIACLMLWLLPSVILGHNKNFAWLNDWWHLINPSNKKNILDVEERSFHSLTTLFTTLFIENPEDIYALPIKRNILNLSIEQLSLILNGTRLMLIGLTLYFLNSLPFKNAKSKQHQFYELSYILCLVPLIFPHQQHYAFLFLFPAIIVVLYFVFFNSEIQSRKQKIVIISALVVIYLSFNLKVLVGEFNPYYEHFKILTYGSIFLVFLLFYKPIKNSFT